MQTEYEFTLPRGYIDGDGRVHRLGVMRLGQALDEIEALHHPHARDNDGWLPVLLLSRVVTRLGDLPAVTPQVVAGLFAADLLYLEDLYLRLNSVEQLTVVAVCPYCQGSFQLRVAPILGE